MTVKDILFTLPQRFKPRKKHPFEGTIHFKIKGSSGGEFTVQVTPEGCQVTSGLTGEPTCVVETTDTLYIDIELGRKNPQVAFLTRKVRLSNVSAFVEFSKQFIPYHKWQQGSSLGHTDLPQLKGPLSGVQILDLSRLYPAPLATMWLADLGARVIKIEHPRSPDPMREYPPFLPDGQAAGFLAVNRNKLSLALDITDRQGQAIFWKLVEHSDVVVASFRPGRLKAMGVDYERARGVNPKIIYLSLLGYPPTSSLSEKGSHDVNYMALSGGLDVTGTPERPVIPGFQIADVLGAYTIVIHLLLALLERQSSGVGKALQLSLLEAVMPAVTLQVAQHAAAPEMVQRGRGILNGGMAAYNIYQCADGQFIALAAIEPKFWEAFCEAVGHPEWKTHYFNPDRVPDPLIEEVAKVIASQPREYWEQLAQTHDFCLTPVLSIGEVPRWLQQQGAATNWLTLQGIPQVHLPLGDALPNQNPAPALGAHTLAIMRQLGYPEAEIRQFQEQGVIA